jgi:hypothetical protein
MASAREGRAIDWQALVNDSGSSGQTFWRREFNSGAICRYIETFNLLENGRRLSFAWSRGGPCSTCQYQIPPRFTHRLLRGCRASSSPVLDVVQESLYRSSRNGLMPVGGVELGKNIFKVTVDGPFGDAEGPSNLRRGLTFRCQP